MKARYIAAGAFLLLLYFVFVSAQHGKSTVSFATIGASNGTINIAINETYAYIQLVNESGYLIFSPNLTQAYNYYYRAVNLSANDPDTAVTLLAQAKQSASQQQQLIYGYRDTSFIVMAVLTVVSALILAYFMWPRPQPPSRRRGQK